LIARDIIKAVEKGEGVFDCSAASKELTEEFDEAEYVYRRLKRIYQQAMKLEHSATNEDVEKLLHQVDLDLIAEKMYQSTKVYRTRHVSKKHWKIYSDL